MGHFLQAILLGLLQGLTEFLPVSSSGHLAIGMKLFGWNDPKSILAFAVAVHVGSLGAVLVFSRREIRAMLTSQPRLLAVLAVATLPVALAGLLAKDIVGQLARNMFVVVGGLVFTGCLLGYARRRDQGAGTAPALSWGRTLGIGLAQALALLPGVSRSGSALVAGLAAGLERDQALRFAFLLAAPAIAGAGLLMVIGGDWGSGLSAGPLLAGTLVSFLSSLLAMKVMVQVVAKRRLGWFGLYCFAAGLFAFGLGWHG